MVPLVFFSISVGIEWDLQLTIYPLLVYWVCLKMRHILSKWQHLDRKYECPWIEGLSKKFRQTQTNPPSVQHIYIYTYIHIYIYIYLCALLATEVNADSHHHRESCDGRMAQGCSWPAGRDHHEVRCRHDWRRFGWIVSIIVIICFL